MSLFVCGGGVYGTCMRSAVSVVTWGEGEGEGERRILTWRCRVAVVCASIQNMLQLCLVPPAEVVCEQVNSKQTMAELKFQGTDAHDHGGC